MSANARTAGSGPDPSSTAAELAAVTDHVERIRERVAHLAEPWVPTGREDVTTTLYEAERQLLMARRALRRALDVVER